MSSRHFDDTTLRVWRCVMFFFCCFITIESVATVGVNGWNSFCPGNSRMVLFMRKCHKSQHWQSGEWQMAEISALSFLTDVTSRDSSQRGNNPYIFYNNANKAPGKGQRKGTEQVWKSITRTNIYCSLWVLNLKISAVLNYDTCQFTFTSPPIKIGVF